MATYRVITGPAVTRSGMLFGANTSVSGDPFAKIIAQQASEGYVFVQVFGHEVRGAYCCIIPDKVIVNLLVFRKD